MSMGYNPAYEDLRRKIQGNQVKKMNQRAADKFSPQPTGPTSTMPPAPPAPKPVAQPKPVAGPGVAGPSPMVPGVPVQGPASLAYNARVGQDANVAANRKAQLDAEISARLKQVIPIPLGTPGRDEEVARIRQLKAERAALDQSTAPNPNFLTPEAAVAKQRQMQEIQRAELQRRLEALNTASPDRDRLTMEAGRNELWRRGQGDMVLQDKSGDLRRQIGSDFNADIYMGSGGAYGSLGGRAASADDVRRNAEKQQVLDAIARLGKEQADLDSGKYEADYRSREGDRQNAIMQAEIRRQAGLAQADKMKASRDLETQNATDDAQYQRKLREIVLSKTEAEALKAKSDLGAQTEMSKVAPVLARGQADQAINRAFYQSLGTTDVAALRQSAMNDWNGVVKPVLGGPLTDENAVSNMQFVEPNRAQFWVNKYVDPLVRMAQTNPQEARVAAKALLESMPYGGVSVQGNRAVGPESAMSELTGIPLLVRLARMLPNANATSFANILEGAYTTLKKIAGEQ